MEQQSVRKTYKYKLKPTPEQERALDRTLMLCRSRLQRRCGRAPGSLAHARRLGQLLSTASGVARHQGGHARIRRGQRSGLARCRVAGRPSVSGILSAHAGMADAGVSALPWPRAATTASPIHRSAAWRATLDNSFLPLQDRAGSPCAGHARWKARPRPSRSAGKRTAGTSCISCADVPVQPLPATGQETGIDLGIEAFATLSDGTRIFHPGWYRKAERALKTAQRRVSRRKKGSNSATQGGDNCLPRRIRQVRRQRQDFHHKTALGARSAATISSIMRTCRRPTWSRITILPRASPTRGGRPS